MYRPPLIQRRWLLRCCNVGNGIGSDNDIAIVPGKAVVLQERRGRRTLTRCFLSGLTLFLECFLLFFHTAILAPMLKLGKRKKMDIWTLILGVVLGGIMLLAGMVWLVVKLLRASGRAYMDSIDKM